MLKKIKQKISGSILVFTLIVLFIILATAIGIASVTVIERKTAGTTGKSTAGFQVADSGAEVILQKIYKDDSLTDLNSLAASLGTTCSNGTISGSISSGKDYTVTFYDDADPAVIVPCGDPVSNVAKIKSVGTYAGTSRAIEVAVAAGGPPPTGSGREMVGLVRFSQGSPKINTDMVLLRGNCFGSDASDLNFIGGASGATDYGNGHETVTWYTDTVTGGSNKCTSYSIGTDGKTNFEAIVEGRWYSNGGSSGRWRGTVKCVNGVVDTNVSTGTWGEGNSFTGGNTWKVTDGNC
ncbi:MAG: hypothetical protein NT136_01995 [Candidatus Moranbacteria bacterium]|nr:hypothetical protein [Candidatus Moranbacteria bacterium]